MVPLDTWSVPEERLQAPSISKSDTFFLKQNLEFVWGAQDIDLTELNDLFTKVIPCSSASSTLLCKCEISPAGDDACPLIYLASKPLHIRGIFPLQIRGQCSNWKEFVKVSVDGSVLHLNYSLRNDLQVGFPSRDLGKLQTALDNTYVTLWIRSTKKSRWAQAGQMLGFARAFSDKSLTATIWDVSVSFRSACGLVHLLAC
jgi:hypothetical protein